MQIAVISKILDTSNKFPCISEDWRIEKKSHESVEIEAFSSKFHRLGKNRKSLRRIQKN